MSDTKFKPIEEITEVELQGLWPLIGGSPHLFEQGKDELKEGLSKGFFESLQVDYYTMAAIVDYLRSKGYDSGTPALHPSESAGIPYQKCPKCDGQGNVSKPPYVPGDVHEWSTTSANHVCDVCNGAKVIPMGVRKVEITDHEHEKEVMMQAFDKVRQIFEKRSWIMQGRGSYPYNDDRYKEEVRYMYDEFDAIRKDTWSQIQSKTFEYRNKIIDQYKAESGKEEAVAFMNWTLESECQYSCSDENQWTNINDPTDSITTDQLYDIYNSKK